MCNLQSLTGFCCDFWRRERDSNPRYSYPYTAFRVRPDRPLRHLSGRFSVQMYKLFFIIRHFGGKKSVFAAFFCRIGGYDSLISHLFITFAYGIIRFRHDFSLV